MKEQGIFAVIAHRECKSDPQTCRDCPFLSRCTRSKNHVKTIACHDWEDTKEWVRQNRLSERGKALNKRRKEMIERSSRLRRNCTNFATHG
ncbi:transposase [Polycladomyces sp. WAk]|uniref:Transposase n=1 Tax=Polycladomyces zharkentensis TaxID=2807616 RepID=A0ABS2WJG0_9BACL|nr:transposase [Polycladomyces sp. WAk]